ncbi:MAG: 23S rRNA (uracil(1939)-C(5))-methyltransferase RlmD [Eubacterium sp.]|nr:23S rRNA (uracil(1939)-C(5))-methyltransferase RlmD [Eubacterium sp.]
MKKNDLIELDIVDLGADGSGIGKWQDTSGTQKQAMAFFVKDALVGDKVRAKIIKLKKTYGYARLMELIEPSPDRVEPKCPVHRQCGGCQIQALSYEKQLAYKQNKILNNLARIGGMDASKIPMEPVIGMKEPFRYRNKAQYPIGRDKNGKLAAGFYAARTHTIIPMKDCCLGVPQNEEVLAAILQWMEQHQIEPYDEANGTGLVRHVLIRYAFATKQLMACIVINGKSLPKAAELADKLRQTEGMTSISISINERRSNVIMGDTVQTLWGADFIEDVIGHVKFQISPLSFYQVNPVQTEILYSKVLEFAGLTGKEIVWDLYCGIGTISLFLAQQAKKVYGIEIVPQAVEDAKRNARINGIENAEFFLGEAEDALEKLTGDTPQVVVVDPPRKGCGEKLLETVLKVKPERVVYVSCDSATLARDLKVLCGDGEYEMVRGVGVDLFCQTVHVECVVLMSRVEK